MNYAMTLFQSLAFSAGYDPSKGPGSSCDTDNASGQCVLPWAGGTKTVSSVVLVANGVSFAVHTFFSSPPPSFYLEPSYDSDIHHYRFSGGLRYCWSMVAFFPHCHMLGRSIFYDESYRCVKTKHKIRSICSLTGT